MPTLAKPPAAESLLASYAELTRTLLPGVSGLCLFDENLDIEDASDGMESGEAERLIRRHFAMGDPDALIPVSQKIAGGAMLVALPLLRSTRKMLAVVCVQIGAPLS